MWRGLSVCVLTLLSGVSSYPTGAPSCTEIHHPGTTPQTSKAPYTFTFDKAVVKPGEEVKFTISGVDGATFKGFLVKTNLVTKNLVTEDYVGKFLVKDAAETKLINCGEFKDNGITHTNPKEKTSITVTWVAPSAPSTYKFTTSVVKSFDTYWLNQDSEEIRVE